jgi:hypothetical protein
MKAMTEHGAGAQEACRIVDVGVVQGLREQAFHLLYLGCGFREMRLDRKSFLAREGA